MVAKRRDAKREEFWRQALLRRSESGLTIAEFCAREGLTQSAFQHWRREIKQRDAASRSTKNQRDYAPALVPVQLVDDLAGAAAIEIVAKNGYVIRVGNQATSEQLRRVLQAVGDVD